MATSVALIDPKHAGGAEHRWPNREEERFGLWGCFVSVWRVFFKRHIVYINSMYNINTSHEGGDDSEVPIELKKTCPNIQDPPARDLSVKYNWESYIVYIYSSAEMG